MLKFRERLEEKNKNKSKWSQQHSQNKPAGDAAVFIGGVDGAADAKKNPYN